MSQLFIPQHYAAFDDPKPDLDDPQTRREREHVQNQFLWLHDQLIPYIKEQKWDIHPHYQKNHLTSSTHFIWIDTDTGQQPIVDKIEWLWLHYGKSQEQLNFYKNLPGSYQFTRRDDSDYSNAFYVHARIQFYLTNEYFGVWLLYTDKDRYDKSEFLKKLTKKPFQDTYYGSLKPLYDHGYNYVVNDEYLPLISGLDPTELLRFIRKSHAPGYSGIQKKYTHDDPKISTENIVKTMKENLDLLYPLYDLMAFRQRIQERPVGMTGLFGGNVRVKQGARA